MEVGAGERADRGVHGRGLRNLQGKAHNRSWLNELNAVSERCLGSSPIRGGLPPRKKRS